MKLVFFIAIAGAIGAVSRYGISSYLNHAFGDNFAYGTLAVNILGCLLISIVMYIGLTTDIIRDDFRLAISIGFLGALTTFSTFSYETFKYIEDKDYFLAFGNIALNVVCCLTATFVGLIIARIIIGES